MTKFKLTYNPYLIKASIEVLIEDEWTSVNEESGLLYISNMRLQHWISSLRQESEMPCFFDHLCEATGDNEITICFLGTKEDFVDLCDAARIYNTYHPFRMIVIEGGKKTTGNSCAEKLSRIRQILNEAKTSSFSFLLPDYLWQYTGEILNPISTSYRVISLSKWTEFNLLAPTEWRLTILTVPFEDIKKTETRYQFSLLSRELSKTSIGIREGERFILICESTEQDRTNLISARGVVEKVLMEYGLHVLQFFFLTRKELSQLGLLDTEEFGGSYQVLCQTIDVYQNRYAEQIRLRKTCEVLLKCMKDEGYGSKSQNLIKVEEKLKNNVISSRVSDKDVYIARDWIAEFIYQLNHLLDVSGEVGGSYES